MHSSHRSRLMKISRLHWVVFLALLSAQAFARNASGVLTVTATVANVCAVSQGGGNLAFGVYDPVNANANSPLAQVGTFQLQCTTGTNATIGLSQGANPAAFSTEAAPLRNLSNGSQKLAYQIYTTVSKSAVWDNVTGVAHQADGTRQTISVYGTIPPGQVVASGNYADTVVITISY